MPRKAVPVSGKRRCVPGSSLPAELRSVALAWPYLPARVRRAFGIVARRFLPARLGKAKTP